jgi:hypothetical protein
MGETEKLMKEIAKVVAKECSMYSETPIESSRCMGAAVAIWGLVKEADPVARMPKK